MCIAIYLPEFKEISEETLKICNDANPDGFGFAFFNDKNELVLNKEVDEKKILRKIKVFPLVRKNFIHRPFLIHFRIATHGKISQRCCHPFKVDNDLVFCHNGVLPHSYGTTKDSKSSDTMMFNKNILQRIEKKDINKMMEGNNQILKDLLEGYIGDRNKVILLDSMDNVQILNEKVGIWDKGIWFSNDSYKKRKPIFNYGSYGGYWQGQYWDNKEQCWKSWDDWGK